MKTRRTYFNPTSPPRKVKSTQTCKINKKEKEQKEKHTTTPTSRYEED